MKKTILPKFHLTPDIKDIRDYIYEKKVGNIPPTADLRIYCTPIRNQKRLGSCTSFARVGATELILRRNTSISNDLSERFTYYVERSYEGTIFTDSGATIRDSIKSGVLAGITTEKLCPYSERYFWIKPSKAAFKDALTRVTTKYSRIVDPALISDCLAYGFPVITGIPIHASFETNEVMKTGIVPMPGNSEDKLLGGHAVLLVGYIVIDGKLYYILRNSWGSEVGQQGYFFLPFGYPIMDSWMIEN